jgi:hypothetical protein
MIAGRMERGSTGTLFVLTLLHPVEPAAALPLHDPLPVGLS